MSAPLGDHVPSAVVLGIDPGVTTGYALVGLPRMSAQAFTIAHGTLSAAELPWLAEMYQDAKRYGVKIFLAVESMPDFGYTSRELQHALVTVTREFGIHGYAIRPGCWKPLMKHKRRTLTAGVKSVHARDAVCIAHYFAQSAWLDTILRYDFPEDSARRHDDAIVGWLRQFDYISRGRFQGREYCAVNSLAYNDTIVDWLRHND